MRTLSVWVILAILGTTFASSSYGDSSNYDAGIEAFKRGHYQVAMYEFELKAKRGDPMAQYHVALMYHRGYGVNEDKIEAEKWYKMATDQNEPHAQYKLAILYLEWEDKDVAMIKGTIKELLNEAQKNPRLSKELVAEAQYQLGKIYEDANGEEAKPDSARYWYEKAANQGHAEAQYRLGEMYWNGEGMKEANLDSAKYWYERAADRMDGDKDIGHAEAQYKLSLMYLDDFKLKLKTYEFLKNIEIVVTADTDLQDKVNALMNASGLPTFSDVPSFLDWLERTVNQDSRPQYDKEFIMKIIKNMKSQHQDSVDTALQDGIEALVSKSGQDLVLFLVWLERAINQDPKAQYQKGVIHQHWSPAMMDLANKALKSKNKASILEIIKNAIKESSVSGKDVNIEDTNEEIIEVLKASVIYEYKINFKEAEEWYEKAAYQGSYIAKNELAAMYHNCIKLDDFRKKEGDFPNKSIDNQTAKEYYTGCEQLGDEIKKTKAEKMIRLYLEGAQQGGDYNSQLNFGEWFEEGLKYDDGKILIKQNYKEAYYWYRLAATRIEPTWQDQIKKRIIQDNKEVLKKKKEENAERVERAKNQLTDKEITEIDSLVHSWQPKILENSGTGFYINSEYILTNAHVVCSNYRDISPGDSCVPYDELRVSFQRVDSVIVDVDVDLALLRVDSDENEDSVAKPRGINQIDTFVDFVFALLHVDSDKNENPMAKLRETNIQVGKKVAVFGYPRSSELSYLGNFTEGVVSGLSEPIRKEKIKYNPQTREYVQVYEYNPQAYNRFQYTAAVQPGNSGGPVLDEAGNVIGVVVTRFEPILKSDEDGNIKIEDPQNINFAINLDIIKKFLKDNDVTYESTTSDSPLTWEEIAKQAQKFTVPVLGFKNK